MTTEQPRIHLSLRVHDLDRSVAFYSTLFQTPPDKLHPGYARFMPADVPVLLALMPGAGEGSGRLDHLGIRLPSRAALDAAMARLGEQVAFTQEGTTCCWAVQDKLWLSDPDGHKWEVYIVTDEHPEQASEPDEQPPCCAGAA